MTTDILIIKPTGSSLYPTSEVNFERRTGKLVINSYLLIQVSTSPSFELIIIPYKIIYK